MAAFTPSGDGRKPPGGPSRPRGPAKPTAGGRNEASGPGLLTRIVATGCFAGYIPVASGTFGSLVGCLILLLPGVWQPAVLVPLALLGFAGGVVTAGAIARHEGGRLTALAAQTKARFQPGGSVHPDPSIVVIDEIVGMWLAVLLLPPSLPALLIAFVFFRLFDVVKPVPARSAEHLPGGWGIMLDDVVAGVYANLATRISLYVLALTHAL
ncbi:MAG TPA: phosphatidylglycerophosphatase A [Bacteroidota bacterium]